MLNNKIIKLVQKQNVAVAKNNQILVVNKVSNSSCEFLLDVKKLKNSKRRAKIKIFK